MVSLDRNACIAIDVFRYFMHRRICQTLCQTLAACICTLSAGHGLLSKQVTFIYLLSKHRKQHHDLASCMTGCKNKKSRGILQVAGAPVGFTMSCSHRSLTFLLWHILVTRCTPERLKPLTHTLVWRFLYGFLYGLFFCLFLFLFFLFSLMTSHRLFTHSLAWPQTTFLSYRRISLAHHFFFLLRSTPYI